MTDKTAEKGPPLAPPSAPINWTVDRLAKLSSNLDTWILKQKVEREELEAMEMKAPKSYAVESRKMKWGNHLSFRISTHGAAQAQTKLTWMSILHCSRKTLSLLVTCNSTEDAFDF